MADRIVKVSDLSGEIIAQDSQLAHLVVEGYGEFEGSQITLDVKPAEIEGEIPEDGDLVALSYYPPGEAAGRRFFMERGEFEKLAPGADMAQLLESARSAQAALEETTRRRGRRGAQTSQTDKIDYGSPEHAGEPHRGRATEAEQEYVRTHLPEVNDRLRKAGKRVIDPADPKMAERYGLEAEAATEPAGAR
jgi:hypothetical protein